MQSWLSTHIQLGARSATTQTAHSCSRVGQQRQRQPRKINSYTLLSQKPMGHTCVLQAHCLPFATSPPAMTRGSAHSSSSAALSANSRARCRESHSRVTARCSCCQSVSQGHYTSQCVKPPTVSHHTTRHTQRCGQHPTPHSQRCIIDTGLASAQAPQAAAAAAIGAHACLRLLCALGCCLLG